MEIYNSNNRNSRKISSSKGNQIKMIDDNSWYKIDYLGYEGLAEFLVSKLLAYTNITEYVKYDITKISLNDNIYIGCRSKNFLKEDEEIVTADRLFKSFEGISAAEFVEKEESIVGRISSFVEKVEEITGIKNYGPELTRILEWDGFVLNDDRHFNNIAFICNLKTRKIKACALFDSGAAFLSDTRYDYPLNKNVYGLISSVKSKPFSEDFDKQIAACEELYGAQLEIDKNISITTDIAEKIKKYYGNAIYDRVCSIFEHQKMLCDYLCKLSVQYREPQKIESFSD